MRKNIAFLTILLLIPLFGAGCGSNQPAPVQTSGPTDQPKASQLTQTYTLDDVAKHSTASDCWQAYRGKVYDVTSYIPNHPAGDKILAGCGKDITAMYEGIKDGKGHSDFAKSLMGDYFKGDLK